MATIAIKSRQNMLVKCNAKNLLENSFIVQNVQVYTSAAQSFTARSCHTTANIQAAFPDVQVQECHRDYCNTSPLFPDTPSPSRLCCFAAVFIQCAALGVKYYTPNKIDCNAWLSDNIAGIQDVVGLNLLFRFAKQSSVLCLP
jgi:hypothetical protein